MDWWEKSSSVRGLWEKEGPKMEKKVTKKGWTIDPRRGGERTERGCGLTVPPTRGVSKKGESRGKITQVREEN